MYQMKVSERGGGILLTWNKDDIKDVEKAKVFFDKQTKQGWLALKRNHEFQRILEFKPEYRELRFIPLSEGG